MKQNRWNFNEPAALRRAYMTLLELPHGATRIKMQPVLAQLRDAIAADCGREPQDIQDSYEEWVRENPSEYARFEDTAVKP